MHSLDSIRVFKNRISGMLVSTVFFASVSVFTISNPRITRRSKYMQVLNVNEGKKFQNLLAVAFENRCVTSFPELLQFDVCLKFTIWGITLKNIEHTK